MIKSGSNYLYEYVLRDHPETSLPEAVLGTSRDKYWAIRVQFSGQIASSYLIAMATTGLADFCRAPEVNSCPALKRDRGKK